LPPAVRPRYQPGSSTPFPAGGVMRGTCDEHVESGAGGAAAVSGEDCGPYLWRLQGEPRASSRLSPLELLPAELLVRAPWKGGWVPTGGEHAVLWSEYHEDGEHSERCAPCHHLRQRGQADPRGGMPLRVALCTSVEGWRRRGHRWHLRGHEQHRGRRRLAQGASV
jgi:hypothetical protein